MRQQKRTLSPFTLAALSLLLAHTSLAASADASALRIEWQKTPIAIELGVGEERLVHFRRPVSVGVPGTLPLRTQTVSGTVYLLAKAPFGKTRLIVREMDGGQTYLLDLSANTHSGSLPPIEVTLDERQTENRSQPADRRAQHDTVSLTRYAAQQLYAPLRLLSSVVGIVRVPLQSDPVDLIPGHAIEAKPLIGWRAGNLYVTAVKLTNQTNTARTLDPRTLRGAWLSAAFQHARLLAAGDEADTTAVYLVSTQPFSTAL